MKRTIQLLIIDPQNDFCDLPASWRPADPLSGAAVAPALPVAGAHADMLRLADVIQRGAQGISDITVTLDSHHRFDIAHPTFWKNRGRRGRDTVHPDHRGASAGRHKAFLDDMGWRGAQMRTSAQVLATLLDNR